MVDELLRNLDKTPSKSSVYVWADYIELRCLLHPDRYFTLDGAEEALQEASDYSADSVDQQLASCNEGLDKLAERWEECERVLTRRQALFREAYPFSVSGEFRGLEVAEDADNPLRQWYRFLLLASALQYVPRHNQLTSAFERASYTLFKHLTPRGAEVHGFWPGAHHYPNDKAGRLTKLAIDLRGIASFTDNAFNLGDRGDAGIDLVAWHPMGDQRDRIPIALGQCGCSVEEWKTKPLSVSRNNLSQKIFIGPDWWQFYFMPLEMCGQTGKWADGAGDLPSVIVVDRSRFIGIARDFDLILPDEALPLLEQLDAFRFH